MKIKIPLIHKILNKYREKIINQYLYNINYEKIYDIHLRCKQAINTKPPKTIEFTYNNSPQVSIIIPVYNQYEITMNCLFSIKSSTATTNYEIILVDDNSTDKTKEIEKYVKNINIIRNSTNQGFLKNCNIAAKAARGDYLYFLNNDTILFPNALEELTQTLDTVPDCGVVGSKLIYPDGKIQSAGSKLGKNLIPSLIGTLHNPYEPEFNIQKEVDYVCGASLMTKKSLWQELKGFDEIFSPGYFEETDYCLRIKKIGLKIIYQPKSEVIHFTSCSYKEKANKLQEKNQKIFRKKHKT